MSHGIYSESVLAARNFDTHVSMPYTTHVLPIHTIVNRPCRCSPQTSPSDGTAVTYLDPASESKNSHSLGHDAMTTTSYNWQVLAGNRRQVPDTIAAFLEEGNLKQEEEEEEEGEEEGKERPRINTAMDINNRIPSIRVDQKSSTSCPKERIPSAPVNDETAKDNLSRKQSHSSHSVSQPHPSSLTKDFAGTTQDDRRLSSTGSERIRHGRPAMSPGHHPTLTSGRKAKPWSLEMIFLTLALLFISPVSGGYDKGGPQHRITWGRGNSPPGSAVFGNSPVNVTAVVGHRARLPCQVKNLGLKDVSWIRQRDLHILTVGIFTYTSDDRFKVFHPHETEDWFLDISSVTFRDSGIYECQVSTSPKVSLPIFLTVLGVQEADIPGPSEVFIQHGSTISLQCEVQAGVEAVGPVHWLKGAATLNYSSPRGGISMEVEKTPTKTMSKLYITRALRADSGNYTCAPLFAKPDSVLVHVVNAGEESAAAVHSGSSHCNLVESILLIWAAALLPVSWLFLNLSSTRP